MFTPIVTVVEGNYFVEEPIIRLSQFIINMLITGFQKKFPVKCVVHLYLSGMR
ncbi:hypothetical protein LOT_1674 [Lentilactobacillus otakiensis DSM 19908 = JCM 15040]|uniref:Uncharacterized protein n=1 Tax=Lentilactobacillus otakiensis DSM 19908 = JCM 15040 TaxID=1423780 RepID=S4NMS3_9LACO|nr:hypothetical protein LOT_1674 [Lentilactobacillus otakiensis DSM 19908 = JCM 15040]